MTTIAVVDHGAGNLVSIAQGLTRVGAEVIVATSPDQLASADGVVLPGVGTTKGVMDGISAGGFYESIADWNRPLFGICVGMQVLFEHSAEDDAACFGFMAGSVDTLSQAPRLPHIGWNDLDVAVATDTRQPAPLLRELPDDPTFYFVHSFAPQPTDHGVVLATADYGETFAAAVQHGNIVGTQFHPERSGDNGLQVLSNFLAMCA